MLLKLIEKFAIKMRSIFFVSGCKHVKFCCTVEHLNTGSNCFGASPKWPFEELQFFMLDSFFRPEGCSLVCVSHLVVMG